MEDQERKFVCKWCNKRFPCGKSLGGHIRSHMIANSVESAEKIEANLKKLSSLIDEKSSKAEPQVELGGNSSYVLRENPRKTFKAVDAIASFPLPQEKVCKQCGKVFQSLEALCGHMACHSEKDKGLKEDHSWTSENKNLVMDSHSDTESEDRCLRSKAKSKRYKRIAIKSSSLSLGNGSSSASEIDHEQDQEEVAMCLMMLSRDSGNWGGVNSVVESSDNHSVVLETKSSSIDMKIGRKDAPTSAFARDETPQTKKVERTEVEYTHHTEAEVFEQENSDSDYYLGEVGKVESDTSFDGFLSNATVYENKKPNVSKGVKNEETLAEIRKGFNRIKGYQSDLKGNKKMKRENGRSALLSKLAKYGERNKSNDSYEDIEVLNDSFRKVRHASPDVELPKRAQKRSKYECMNCKKTFNTYQGLGGHRPCHKKINYCYEEWYETGENSVEEDTDLDENNKRVKEPLSKKKAIAKDFSCKVEKKISCKKNKNHECPFCHRTFKNGQALGGHKRSHFLGGGGGGGGGGGPIQTKNRPPILKAEEPELLDLNLPAPLEDEVDEQIVSW